MQFLQFFLWKKCLYLQFYLRKYFPHSNKIHLLLFHYFNQYFNQTIELIFNILLIIFLLHFIYTKIKTHYSDINFHNELTSISKTNIIIKTLGFTYLNPHVYSDTVFFLGNFAKNFLIKEKIFFGIGASISSFIFFFLLGYLSKHLSKFAQSAKVWRMINIFIISLERLLN